MRESDGRLERDARRRDAGEARNSDLMRKARKRNCQKTSNSITRLTSAILGDGEREGDDGAADPAEGIRLALVAVFERRASRSVVQNDGHQRAVHFDVTVVLNQAQVA